MEDDEFERKMMNGTVASMKAESLHRQQIQELELRRAMLEVKTAELFAIAADVQCRKLLGLPTKSLNERLKRLTETDGEVIYEDVRAHDEVEKQSHKAKAR